ncbi:MAG: hypothetical protein JJE16_04130 [Nitrospiraceae bacterium]|nr:hypothetical protein [Nitrospiraceae bacterium]
MPVPAECIALSDEIEELKQERNALQTELRSAAPDRKRGLVNQIKHLNSSIDAKNAALDACVAQYGGSQTDGSQPPIRRSVLAGTLTVRISPLHEPATGTTGGNMDLVVQRAVHLMLDFSPDGRVVTLLSGWPTVLFDDSGPFSPARLSLRVSLSNSLPGTIDPAGQVTLPMILHLDYEPNPILATRDQDVALMLTSNSGIGQRIWEQAPTVGLSASVSYATTTFLIWGRVSHTLQISLSGTVNPPPAPYPADETVWFDGALPDGARADADNEVSFVFDSVAGAGNSFLPIPPDYPSPAPGRVNGLLVHSSSPLKTGMSQHFFDGAGQTLTVGGGDRLFAYVYLLDLAELDEIMLQWNDGTWEHRAFWGADLVPFGVTGTVSRKRIGALPTAGVWTRLEVPAADIGLGGRTLNGMAFTVNTSGSFYCAWGRAGKLS